MSGICYLAKRKTFIYFNIFRVKKIATAQSAYKKSEAFSAYFEAKYSTFAIIIVIMLGLIIKIFVLRSKYPKVYYHFLSSFF